MTPDQEINKIRLEYTEHWSRLEKIPAIRQAIVDKNPVRLGELAARFVYGNTPTKEELAEGEADHKYHSALKERERLIQERKRNSN